MLKLCLDSGNSSRSHFSCVKTKATVTSAEREGEPAAWRFMGFAILISQPAVCSCCALQGGTSSANPPSSATQTHSLNLKPGPGHSLCFRCWRLNGEVWRELINGVLEGFNALCSHFTPCRCSNESMRHRDDQSRFKQIRKG